MRMETKIGLFLNSLGIALSRFTFFPDYISEFLSGLFFTLGLIGLVLGSLLSEEQYNNLLYHKWLTRQNDAAKYKHKGL